LRELAPPRALAGLVEAALTLPCDGNLRRLAQAVAQLPTPDHGPALAVRLQIWQVRHDPATLAPESRLLRAYELPLGDG
jgi:hypothetical protein